MTCQRFKLSIQVDENSTDMYEFGFKVLNDLGERGSKTSVSVHIQRCRKRQAHRQLH